MGNGPFWGYWLIDSSIKGLNPVTRFINGLVKFFYIPFMALMLLCILVDANYFFIFGFILKSIWVFWILPLFYYLTHFSEVVKTARCAMFSQNCPEF